MIAADPLPGFDQQHRKVGPRIRQRKRRQCARQPSTDDDQRRTSIHSLAIVAPTG